MEQIVLKLALNIEQVRTVVGRRQVIYDKKNLLRSWGKSWKNCKSETKSLTKLVYFFINEIEFYFWKI